MKLAKSKLLSDNLKLQRVNSFAYCNNNYFDRIVINIKGRSYIMLKSKKSIPKISLKTSTNNLVCE